MRDLGVVIDQLLEVIPTDEEELISSLQSTKSSFLYCAPEMIYFWWNQLTIILNERVFTEMEFTGWKEEVRKIFVDEK